MDLEEGLPEAIKLTVAGWTHVQELDYKQLPYKCRRCHGHGHFAKNYKKKVEEQADKQNGEQWTLIQKNANSKKGTGKGNMAGGPSSAKSNQETEATPNGTISAQINQVTLLQENVE